MLMDRDTVPRELFFFRYRLLNRLDRNLQSVSIPSSGIPFMAGDVGACCTTVKTSKVVWSGKCGLFGRNPPMIGRILLVFEMTNSR